MNNDLFKKYANIKAQIDELEKQAEELKPDVLAELKIRTQEMVDKALRFEYGTFSVCSRKVWTYSPIVDEQESALKETKRLEELNGTAKAEVYEGLRVTI